jgi:type VI secretion system VasD/TssJ family lipoprotein
MCSTLRLATLALALAGATGCALFGRRRDPPPPPPPPPVVQRELPPPRLEVTLSAAPTLNPDDQGRPLPTFVRVYQLRSDLKLKGADVARVYLAPKDAIGEDLLRGDEVALKPGATAEYRLEREEGARFLAVVALVRKPGGGSWLSIAELPPPADGGRFRFRVDGYEVKHERTAGPRR